LDVSGPQCRTELSAIRCRTTKVTSVVVYHNSHFDVLRYATLRSSSHVKRAPASYLPPITLQDRGEIPIYRQLYDWFRRAITDGQLRPGQLLPSTRNLAAELKISRMPVLGAFDQLHAEGYVKTSVGAGTCVAGSIPDDLPKVTIASVGAASRQVRERKGLRRISRRGTEFARTPAQPWLSIPGAFRLSMPALDHFPIGVWSKLVARHSRKSSRETLAYGDTMGYMPFREAIAEYLGAVRAVRCSPSQILVTTGSQQGLQITGHVLLNPKAPVWMEEPGYLGARQAFITAGARLIPVPVDQEGLDATASIRRGQNARAVYITPSHQYPLGVTMSATRRMLLLRWAMRTGAWIIEDDYDSEYRFGSRPIASLQGLDSDARVIYVGTLSKVMFPALRLGYVVIPKDLVPAFSAARDATDIFSSTLYQAVMTDFIREGHFARHIRRMRVLYMERRKALVEAIRTYMGDVLEVTGAEAGLHLAALLPPGVNDVTVSRNAMRVGVSVMPLSTCFLKPPARGGLILGYGGSNPHEIHEGIRKLRMCI
jgi:GntR family transcriptional regulator / MocR family aminotransferase